MNTKPNEPAQGAPSEELPTPAAPQNEVPSNTELEGGYAVPGGRSAVLAAIASRRRDLATEVDDPSQIGAGTIEEAADRLKAAADAIDSLDAKTAIEPASSHSLEDGGEEEDDTALQSDAERGAEDERAPLPATEKPAASATPKTPKAPGAVELKPGTMVRVNVGGQIRELPAEQVASLLGHADTITNRLSNLEREVASTRTPAARQGEQPADDGAASPGNQDGGDNPGELISDDELRRIAASIQFGQDDEAKTALRDLVTTVVTKATTAAVKQARDETTDAQRVADLEKTVKTLATEFRDVMEDKGLRLLAVESVFEKRAMQLASVGHDPNVINKCLASADGRRAIIKAGQLEAERGRLPSHEEVFRDALTMVRNQYGRGPSPKSQGDGDRPAASDRKDAKRRIASPPPTATGARAAMPANDSPGGANPSDIVAKMRKARGQLVA